MPKLDDQGRDQQQDGDLDARDGETAVRDSATTRRALLTGGAVVAGAAVATLATTEQAAAANVVLGAVNNATTTTTFRSTGSRAVTGTVSAASAVGLSGSSSGTGGSGVLGIANTSGNSYGVWGVASRGSGVRGESSLGIGVQGVCSGNGYGVRGNGGYNGVYGNGGSYGVIGSSAGYGVYGSGDTAVYASGGTYGVQAYGSDYGVYGSASSYGVYGRGTYGVFGTGTIGVYGTSSAHSGVYGSTSHPNYAAVTGSGGMYGVQGEGGRTAGVRGDSGYVGVWGEGPDWGFFSIATRTTGQNYGIMSESKSPAGFAGYFKGNVQVVGNLAKSTGSFLIDHPLDPERKWLRHSFVESPDMMNVYNGNVTTDASGFATVKLPAYFGALNRDFRYQLTVIGTFAQAIVDREIQNNQFRIRTDKGRVKVSWQVTGIRQDDYAKAHPIVVEEAKKGTEAGARIFVPKGSSARLMNVGPKSPISGPVSLPAVDAPPPQPAPPPRP